MIYKEKPAKSLNTTAKNGKLVNPKVAVKQKSDLLDLLIFAFRYLFRISEQIFSWSTDNEHVVAPKLAKTFRKELLP